MESGKLSLYCTALYGQPNYCRQSLSYNAKGKASSFHRRPRHCLSDYWIFVSSALLKSSKDQSVANRINDRAVCVMRSKWLWVPVVWVFVLKAQWHNHSVKARRVTTVLIENINPPWTLSYFIVLQHWNTEDVIGI